MNNLLSASKIFFRRNSSTILTCVGAIGVVATTVMAVKATPKALSLIDAQTEEKGEKLTRLETIAVAAPAYAPCAITGIVTIGCIFGANVLNKRSQASLTSAYALLDRSYKDYKKKVDELYGEETGEHVRAEIAKDKYKEQKVPSDDGKQLFYDFYSGRYFESTLAEVIEAEYSLNQCFITRDYAYLNEFYEFLGIEGVPSGYELGWSTGSCLTMYWENWITFEHETIAIDDDIERYDDADEYRGLECTIIHMKNEPIIGFEDYC